MIWNIYAIYDNKARVHLAPWVSQNHATATRSFAEAVNNSGPFGKNPHDYVLFHVGTYDDVTGVLTDEHAKVNLGLAANFKEQGNGIRPSEPT